MKTTARTAWDRLCRPHERRRFLVSLAAITASALPPISTSFAAPPDDREGASTDDPTRQAEAAELREVEAEAGRVGISPLSSLKSSHYQVIGNASPGFMKLVLQDCERVARDFIDHFRTRGFEVSLPRQRMTIVAFVDERPFARFFPEATEHGASGAYSRPKNRIVLFDWRNVPMQPRSANANMTTLAHEATHQLCFNSGLLSRESDIPLCIVEGLGLYAENRRLTGWSDLGLINRGRLDALAHILRRRKWIPLNELLTLELASIGADPDQLELLYAESWLLIFEVMKDPDRRNQFRNYLKEVSSRRDPSHRIDDAETHFGNLERFDRALRVSLVRLQQSR